MNLIPCSHSRCSNRVELTPEETKNKSVHAHEGIRTPKQVRFGRGGTRLESRAYNQFRHMGPTSGILIFYSHALFVRVCNVVSKFLNRNRNISTSRLHPLRDFHLKPINVIISHGSITIPNLEAGFPLRCFQRLSIPDIATLQSTWR